MKWLVFVVQRWKPWWHRCTSRLTFPITEGSKPLLDGPTCPQIDKWGFRRISGLPVSFPGKRLLTQVPSGFPLVPLWNHPRARRRESGKQPSGASILQTATQRRPPTAPRPTIRTMPRKKPSSNIFLHVGVVPPSRKGLALLLSHTQG